MISFIFFVSPASRASAQASFICSSVWPYFLSISLSIICWRMVSPMFLPKVPASASMSVRVPTKALRRSENPVLASSVVSSKLTPKASMMDFAISCISGKAFLMSSSFCCTCELPVTDFQVAPGADMAVSNTS